MPNGSEIKTIQTKQGVIKYELKDKDASFEYKETDDGYLHINAKNVTVFLPDNKASKIVTGGGNSVFNKAGGGFYGNSENLTIIDGAENNGTLYSDNIQILGDNITYEAARKTKGGKPFWTKDASKGDKILVQEGKNNKVKAKSGNNVMIAGDAEKTKVEAYQGTQITDRGFGTNITVKASPHTKGEEITSTVDIIKSNGSTTVSVEKGTLTTVSGDAKVIGPNGRDITQDQDGDGPQYYKE